MATEEAIEVVSRIIGCDDSYYQEHKGDDQSTLYLVNTGIPVNNSQQDYSDLYYGERKISDICVVDSRPDNTYPDDKLYLVPYDGSQTWTIAGTTIAPVGYNLYYKHGSYVTPVESSLIQEVSYDPTTHLVSIVWQTDSHESVVTDLISSDAVNAILMNMSSTVKQSVSDQVYAVLYQDIVVDQTKSPLGSGGGGSIEWLPVVGN